MVVLLVVAAEKKEVELLPVRQLLSGKQPRKYRRRLLSLFLVLRHFLRGRGRCCYFCCSGGGVRFDSGSLGRGSSGSRFLLLLLAELGLLLAPCLFLAFPFGLGLVGWQQQSPLARCLDVGLVVATDSIANGHKVEIIRVKNVAVLFR